LHEFTQVTLLHESTQVNIAWIYTGNIAWIYTGNIAWIYTGKHCMNLHR